eukprot:TRINITY_DN46395_c0_g1_i4.p4 TRINITY_DN46395_c0_g1~~TRINITY_DN46395_c0_g1_i4.p4  ORF type:complete len:118 (-),score=3.12 TRINITY_DN46395_c0_g1_i4:774-1127(-)
MLINAPVILAMLLAGFLVTFIIFLLFPLIENLFRCRRLNRWNLSNSQENIQSLSVKVASLDLPDDKKIVLLPDDSLAYAIIDIECPDEGQQGIVPLFRTKTINKSVDSLLRVNENDP